MFTPLEMRHSYTSKAAAQRNGLAIGHRAWFGWPIAAPDLPVPVGSLPSGQLIASAEDMGHYLIAQLNDGRYRDAQLLSPASMAGVQHPAVKAASMSVAMGAYAMGWFVAATDQGVRLWHNGQVPDYFAYMALLPEQQRGMVLLVNSNQMLLNFALLGIGEGAAVLLAGTKPDLFPWGVIPWMRRSVLLIPVIQLADVLRTRRSVRRWQSEPASRPGPAKLWLLELALPGVLNLGVGASALGLLATNLRPVLRLFMPDLYWLMVLSGGVASLWIVVRTRLILKAFRATEAGSWPLEARHAGQGQFATETDDPGGNDGRDLAHAGDLGDPGAGEPVEGGAVVARRIADFGARGPGRVRDAQQGAVHR